MPKCVKDKNGVKVIRKLKCPSFDAPVRVQWIDEKKGYGVVATRDIRKGELLTYYPGVVRKRGHESKCYDTLIYAITPKSHPNVIFDGDKDIRENWACGHYINDPIDTSMLIPFDKDKSIEINLVNGLINEKTYNDYVMRTSNCIILPMSNAKCVKVIAICDIKNGEELLTPYTYEYWKDRILGLPPLTKELKERSKIAMKNVMACCLNLLSNPPTQ